MIVIVPLQTAPSQQLQIVLGGQNCQIAVYQKGEHLYMDLQAAGTDISTGVVAHNLVPMVPTVYLGFEGNLLFVDNQGGTDPQWAGLGVRYQLLYMTEADYANLI